MYTYIYHIDSYSIYTVRIYIYVMCVCMCVQSTYGDTGSQVVAEPDSGNGIRSGLCGYEVWASILVFSITVSFFASRGPLDRPSGELGWKGRPSGCYQTQKRPIETVDFTNQPETTKLPWDSCDWMSSVSLTTEVLQPKWNLMDFV